MSKGLPEVQEVGSFTRDVKTEQITESLKERWKTNENFVAMTLHIPVFISEDDIIAEGFQLDDGCLPVSIISKVKKYHNKQ